VYENYIIFRKEFERALYTMGMRMREDEYDALFTIVDKDGSGTVVANCCAV
jgi:Ca2+-binding EF-hand superfamily protein